MLHSRLRQKAWKRWINDRILQDYNDQQEDSGFEDFCLDLIEDIARAEFYTERDREDFDDYVADWFDFSLISAEELINEYEREEQ